MSKDEKVSFKTLGGYIVVKRDTVKEKKTDGGIIIPEKNQKIPYTCNIVDIGPLSGYNEDSQILKENLKSGDKVIVASYAGTKIDIDGEDHFFIKDEDILAVVE